MKDRTVRLFLASSILAGFIALLLLIIDSNPTHATTLLPEPANPISLRNAPTVNEFRVCNSSGIYSQTIQAAIDAAQPGDIIKVAGGNYIEAKPAVSGNLYISKTVHLYGGYTCSDWMTQNPALNISKVLPTTPDISVVDIEGPAAPTLDGFTITGGGGGNHGGGIRIRGSNALVNNNIITGNIAYLYGGGIWVQGGAPVIQNNRIQNNVIPASSGEYGGGVELEGTQATLTGNIIANNLITDSAGFGGGVAILGGGPVTLTNNLIQSNSAATITSTTPAFDVGYGGGVYVSGAVVNMTNNTVMSNTANGVVAFSFGGAFGYGGGIFIDSSPAFTLTANNILSNTASYKYNLYPSGGGLQIQSSNGKLTGNVISGNRANGNTLFGNGGGLAILTSTLTIQGGQISNNKTSINCEGYGGGLHARNSSITIDSTRLDNNCAGNTPFYGLGGGLDFFNSPYTLTNVIVSNNYAWSNDTSVGGLSARGTSPGLLLNNTFANNNGQGIRTGAALTATNNILQGKGVAGTTGISLTASIPVSVTYNNFYNYPNNVKGFALDVSNIIINPNLDSTFHLNAGSPAIDAGTHTNAPDTDFDGEPRAMIGPSGLFKIDMGADERTGIAQTIRRLATQPADLTLIGPGNPQENPGSTGSNDWIGNAVWGGDVNSDGRADLIAGAPNLSEDFDNGPNDTGRVFSIFNNATRRLGVIDLYTSTASLEIRSNIHQQHIAQAFATADVNGDSTRDLIIGASGAANFGVTGTVFIFQGGASLSGTKTLSPTMQATWRVRSGENTSTFGGKNSLVAGKLNNDNIDDVVVAEAFATGPSNRTEAGAVFVLFGSNSLPPLWDLKTTPASLTIYGPANNSQLSGVAVGDVNGDGKLDLIARSPTTAYVFYGPLSAGTRDLATTPADATITGLNGDWLAAGDVDGDGKADIILGRTSEVDVVRGGTLVATQTIGAAAWARITGIAPTTLYAFDWNGDGKSDIFIGDIFANRAYAIYGGAIAGTQNILDRASWLIFGELNGDQFGYSFGGADFDSDGGLDLIIGSRSHVVSNHSLHFEDAGAAYVFYGTGTEAILNQRLYLPLIVK
ncbi:MAG: FG-GAP repeat protein [Chloroflexi bacterium]|nr:FG-GAP repeat protein [Chloroflexota bacterium]